MRLMVEALRSALRASTVTDLRWALPFLSVAVTVTAATPRLSGATKPLGDTSKICGSPLVHLSVSYTRASMGFRSQ